MKNAGCYRRLHQKWRVLESEVLIWVKKLLMVWKQSMIEA